MTVLQLFALSFLFKACAGQYDIAILLRRFDSGGLLANGSNCSPFRFAGVRCSISLKICVEPVSVEPDDDPTHCNSLDSDSQEGFVDLGQVTNGADAINFTNDVRYGAWTNPHIAAVRKQGEIYKGFKLKVKAFHKESNLIIDEFIYTVHPNGAETSGTVNITNQRPSAANPSTLSLAWYVTLLGGGSITTIIPEKIYLDCEDVRQDSKTSGVYRIKPRNARESFKAYCEISRTSSYTVIQSRGEQGNTSVFEAKTFDDYKTPIGEPGWNTNYWLGLRNMRSLINYQTSFIQYGLAIELCCGQNHGATTFYSNLEMTDESDNFRLIGTSPEKIGMNVNFGGTDLNSTFSTYFKFTSDVSLEWCDVINYDGYVSNGTGGWWFGSCTNNLNGHYYEYLSDDFDDKTKCRLKEEAIKKHGSGIEMRTTEDNYDELFSFDRMSWTRARMSLYRIASGAPTPAYDFCSKEPPVTTKSLAEHSPAASEEGVTDPRIKETVSSGKEAETKVKTDELVQQQKEAHKRNRLKRLRQHFQVS